MKLVIEVELGNDAMQSAADAAVSINEALVRQSASAYDPLNEHETGSIHDDNGNTVGTWEVVSP